MPMRFKADERVPTQALEDNVQKGQEDAVESDVGLESEVDQEVSAPQAMLAQMQATLRRMSLWRLTSLSGGNYTCCPHGNFPKTSIKRLLGFETNMGVWDPGRACGSHHQELEQRVGERCSAELVFGVHQFLHQGRHGQDQEVHQCLGPGPHAFRY